MNGKSFWVGVAVLAAGLAFVSGGAAATTTTVTLTVNSTADSVTPCTIANHKSTGTCTLRGAILAANAVQTDNTMFVVKLATKTYHLSQGTLVVDAATAKTGNIVQIVGKTKTIGKKKHKKTVPASIIDGDKNAPKTPASVFEIDSPTQMSNVVITHGTGSAGGGVWMDSALSLTNSLVTDNESCVAYNDDDEDCNAWGDGGGIYMGGGDTQTPHLALVNTKVTDNLGFYGGGIANENTNHTSIFALNSHIDDNVACDALIGEVCIGGGEGGGIYDHGESLYLENSTVNGNQAGSLAYDVNSDESYGGGLVTYDTAQLIRTSVNGNVSGNYGGGIYAHDHVDLVNSTVSHNIADAQGGGVYVDYLLTSKNSSFSDNIVGGTFACTIVGADADAKATCKHSAKGITGDCASLYPSATACINYDGLGGGIYSDEEYPQLVATTISGNLAASIAGDTSSGCIGGVGGGIYSDWTFTLSGGSKVTGNTADCGGGIYNEISEGGSFTFDVAHSSLTKNYAIEDGGAIWTSGSGSGWLVGTTITSNKAGGQTGGVWSDALGSVLFGSGNKITKNTSTGSCKNVTWPCS
jgi:CSLREA domain-containing protein